MNTKRQYRIKELKQLLERRKKLSEFIEKASTIIPIGEIYPLSFKESDNFIKEEWPSDKWEKGLYIQSKLKQPQKIIKALNRFLNIIQTDYVYIFLINFNFGLAKLSKDKIFKKWEDLIALDGDEIIIYNPENGQFICIEKTEDYIIIGQEDNGRIWIYEITISNEELKKEILKGI